MLREPTGLPAAALLAAISISRMWSGVGDEGRIVARASTSSRYGSASSPQSLPGWYWLTAACACTTEDSKSDMLSACFRMAWSALKDRWSSSSSAGRLGTIRRIRNGFSGGAAGDAGLAQGNAGARFG